MPLYLDRLASQEFTVDGIVAGTLQDTHANDSAAENIMEIVSKGSPKSKYSYLEHKWAFQVQPGAALTLFANAWAAPTSENEMFIFSYSTG